MATSDFRTQLSKDLKLTGEQNNLFHASSDVDKNSDAQHHTLGLGLNQAAPGDVVKAMQQQIADLQSRVTALEAP